MKESIVLYPALGRGHLQSMVELGKLILTHHPSFSITVLILTPPDTTTTKTKTNTVFACDDATAKYISTVSAALPSIIFQHIPPTSFTTTLPPQLFSIDISRHCNQNLLHILLSISKTSNLKAIVMDSFNYSGAQVASSLDIPTFFYYTSGVSSLSLLLQYPTIHHNVTKPFIEQPMHVRIPGLPTIFTKDFPEVAQDPSKPGYHVFIDIAKIMNNGVGIIVNTFDAIEERALKALRESNIAPLLFCIGPVISPPCGEENEKGIMRWLDSQPRQSVVLLCFGSLGRFSKAQLMEMAIGLELSQQRFLWVLRSESDESSLEELLPQGFLERTREKGMVVRNWAPQAAILSHESVGGFVTHCGWNSVLEAVCEGVPMVAWPLYAEQKVNRLIMVQEMKVALALSEFEDGFVSATELGDRVKELMDSDKGKEIRQRTFKMKISAIEARAEGGTSDVALNRLAQLWKQY